MVESKMVEFKLAEFKMAAIIKLSQNEWVKFFCANVGTNLGKCEWVWEEKLKWLNQDGGIQFEWEFKMAAIREDQSKMAVESECHRMSEVRFFWVKMAESKMAEFKIAAIIKLSQNEWVKFFCANGWI